MIATVVPFTPPRQPTTVRASVACAHCAWGAVQTGDNAIEVGAFLRALLLRHVAERHPDVAPGDTPA